MISMGISLSTHLRGPWPRQCSPPGPLPSRYPECPPPRPCVWLPYYDRRIGEWRTRAHPICIAHGLVCIAHGLVGNGAKFHCDGLAPGELERTTECNLAAEVRDFCPKCGRKRENTEKFCPNDATPYEISASGEAAQPPEAKPKRRSGGRAGIGCLSLVALIVIALSINGILDSMRSPEQKQEASEARAAADQERFASATATSEARAAATLAAAPKMGQPFRSGNWEYTVHEVKRVKEIGTDHTGTLASLYHDEAKGEFVIVGMTLMNVGSENLGISGSDFELYDSAGVKYRTADPDLFASQAWARENNYEGGVLIPILSTGQIPPNVPERYAIFFDVTPGAQGLKLRLSQAGVDVPLV